MAEQSADAIVTTDLSGRITYWNPGAENLSGHTADDLLGTRVSNLYRGGAEEAAMLMESLKREGQLPNYDLAIRKKDGDWFEASVSVSFLRDHGGAVIGTLAVTKDITVRIICPIRGS